VQAVTQAGCLCWCSLLSGYPSRDEQFRADVEQHDLRVSDFQLSSLAMVDGQRTRTGFAASRPCLYALGNWLPTGSNLDCWILTVRRALRLR